MTFVARIIGWQMLPGFFTLIQVGWYTRAISAYGHREVHRRIAQRGSRGTIGGGIFAVLSIPVSFANIFFISRLTPLAHPDITDEGTVLLTAFAAVSIVVTCYNCWFVATRHGAVFTPRPLDMPKSAASHRSSRRRTPLEQTFQGEMLVLPQLHNYDSEEAATETQALEAGTPVAGAPSLSDRSGAQGVMVIQAEPPIRGILKLDAIEFTEPPRFGRLALLSSLVAMLALLPTASLVLEFDVRKPLLQYVASAGVAAFLATAMAMVAYCGDLPQQRQQRAGGSVISLLLCHLAIVVFLLAGLKAFYSTVGW